MQGIIPTTARMLLQRTAGDSLFYYHEVLTHACEFDTRGKKDRL